MKWMILLYTWEQDTNKNHIEVFHGMKFNAPFDALDYLMLNQDDLDYYPIQEIIIQNLEVKWLNVINELPGKPRL